jgi:hypothetical protein
MMVRLFKILFDDSIETVSEKYSMISVYDQNTIINTEVITSFEYYNEQIYIIYILIVENELECYKNVLEVNNILYLCEDISDSVIDNTFDIEHFFKTSSDALEFCEYYEFIEHIKQWIDTHLSIDSILDRINCYGFDNLRVIDYNYLNK